MSPCCIAQQLQQQATELQAQTLLIAKLGRQLREQADSAAALQGTVEALQEALQAVQGRSSARRTLGSDGGGGGGGVSGADPSAAAGDGDAGGGWRAVEVYLAALAVEKEAFLGGDGSEAAWEDEPPSEARREAQGRAFEAVLHWKSDIAALRALEAAFADTEPAAEEVLPAAPAAAKAAPGGGPTGGVGGPGGPKPKPLKQSKASTAATAAEL
jgi:hypothetical protein